MTKTKSGAVAPKVEPATKGQEPITPHTEILTVEQYKESYVAKFDQNKANIKKLGDKLKKITITGIDDKKNYDLVKSIKTDVATALRVTEDTRVALKEPHLRRGQAIDGYAKELELPLRELKALADGKLKVIDEAKQAEKTRKEREEKELLDARMAELQGAGLRFDGSYYAIGQIALDLVTVSKFSEKQYSGVLAAVKDAKENEDRLAAEELQRKEDEARQLKEAQDKLKAEQEEQLRKEKEIAERMAALELKEKEAKAKELATRQRALQDAGLSFVVMDALYILSTKSGSVEILQKDVEELDDKKWDLVLATIQEDSKAIAVKEEERLKQIEALNVRTRQREAQLVALGLAFDGPGLLVYHNLITGKELSIKSIDIQNLGEESWQPRFQTIVEAIDLYKKEAAEKVEQAAAEMEEQRKMGLSDYEKVMEFLRLLEVDPPVLILEQNYAAMDIFISSMSAAVKNLKSQITK